jgi:branched-chain amino acid transport system ATP-binding protein
LGALLEVRHVSRYFGGLAGNSDVTFSVAKGTVTGLIGPNGAGKTTLFDCITGFYPPSRGEIVFRGKRLNGMSPDKVCKLGMVRTWQKAKPLASLSVHDNALVGALCRAPSLKDARLAADQVLKFVNLSHKSNFLAGSLTIGERKRLEIARALATKPMLLLLDEVMGGLNPAERRGIIRLILGLRKIGMTLIVIEHDTHAIMQISDRVIVLNSGRKLMEGKPADVVSNSAVIEAYLGTE